MYLCLLCQMYFVLFTTFCKCLQSLYSLRLLFSEFMCYVFLLMHKLLVNFFLSSICMDLYNLWSLDSFVRVMIAWSFLAAMFCSNVFS